jgi:hypothetical protein
VLVILGLMGLILIAPQLMMNILLGHQMARKLFFASNRNGNWEIYVMDADGSNPINITKNPEHDKHPSWSPR